jgi:ATP-dependent DNA helicase RecQ
MVFSDVALKDMSTKLPKTLGDFMDINGVGEVKLEKYGTLFIEKIADYCRGRQ